jgi:hypothetical protein
MYAKTQEEAVEEFQALMSSIAEHYEVEYFDCAETRLASLKAKMEECIPDVQK